MPIVRELAPTLLGVALLALLATAVLGVYRVPHRWAPLLAILRGAAQLAVISVVLSGVITSPVWVALALLVMFSVAAATATHRIGWSLDHGTMMAVGMATGVIVTFAIVFTTGAIDFTARYALAIGGIGAGQRNNAEDRDIALGRARGRAKKRQRRSSGQCGRALEQQPSVQFGKHCILLLQTKGQARSPVPRALRRSLPGIC